MRQRRTPTRRRPRPISTAEDRGRRHHRHDWRCVTDPDDARGLSGDSAPPGCAGWPRSSPACALDDAAELAAVAADLDRREARSREVVEEVERRLDSTRARSSTPARLRSTRTPRTLAATRARTSARARRRGAAARARRSSCSAPPSSGREEALADRERALCRSARRAAQTLRVTCSSCRASGTPSSRRTASASPRHDRRARRAALRRDPSRRPCPPRTCASLR